MSMAPGGFDENASRAIIADLGEHLPCAQRSPVADSVSDPDPNRSCRATPPPCGGAHLASRPSTGRQFHGIL